MNFAVMTVSTMVMALALSACGKGSGDSAALPSTTPGGGTSASSDGFSVGVANNDGLFEPIVYQTGSYGSECLIAASVTVSSAAMDCTVDILETDNFFHTVDLEYNVPQDSCDYVVISPSWHWNYSVGYGPSEVTIEVNSSGVVTDVDSSGDNGCRTVQNGVGVTCDAAAEIIGLDGQSPLCEYNHALRTEGAPNCCLGTYNLTIEKDTDDNGSVDETSVADFQPWNGSMANCWGGSPKQNWSAIDSNGLPQSIIQYVEDNGVKDVIRINSNSATFADNFQYGANHYNTTGNPHAHSGYVSASTSNVPYAVEPIDDLDGTSIQSGRAPYTVTCLTRGGEIKHQINIYVREWNTYQQWLTYQTTMGASGDPDLRGAEGVACEYESSFGGTCNDYSDWDDILFNATGGTYDTSTIDAAERRSWFPQVPY